MNLMHAPPRLRDDASGQESCCFCGDAPLLVVLPVYTTRPSAFVVRLSQLRHLFHDPIME